MKTIYKYTLELRDQQTVFMPYGAEILSVHEQNGMLCLWAIVDTDNSTTARIIEIVGTGNPMDHYVSRRFIGTAFVGSYVWHVFEL